MSRSTRRRHGLLAALCSTIALTLTTCSETPLTEGNHSMPTGRPAASFLSAEYNQYQFLGFVEDDQGANDTPAQSDLNAFTRADNVTGKIGVQWVWDDINAWTGSGQTGDACALFDTDGNTKADAAVCVRISNVNGDPNVIAQLASPASPLVYSCGNNKADRCAQPASLAPLGGTVCEVEKITGETFFTAGEDGADVLAACSIPLAAISATSTPNLLNVCSFPSGSPNSNPFDCVVTPGAGFLVLKKATTLPEPSGLTFSFTISPVPAAGASHSILDNTSGVEQTGLLSAAPGTFGVTEGTLPAGWALNTAVCERQTSPTPTGTGTKSGNAVTGVSVTSGETTICTFTNTVVAPSLTVIKAAASPTVPETGGSVTFNVSVTNGSSIPVTLTSLIDDKFGDLDGQGTCNGAGNLYGVIAAGGTYSCSFSGTLGAGEPEDIHVNEVTASATSDGGPATASDTAKVTYSDVLPTISVTKEADIYTITATGGANVTGFAPDQVFARGAGGTGGGAPIFSGNTCDDAGANDQPAQSDLNCFSRADNVDGRMYVRWSWDDINAWTGSGQTGDACALLDTDNNSRANFAFCARITNPNGDPTQIVQVSPGSPILYKCKDAANSGEIDRCASKTFEQTIDVSTVCTVSKVAEHFVGEGEDGFDTQALCNLKLSDLGANVVIANIDLLNVCSFPSGSPNSNPFDCVVTPAAGFLVITKATTPANADAYFAFTLRNEANSANATATNGDDDFAVQGGATSAGIPVLPGTYSLREQMPTGWSQDAITCSRNGVTISGTTVGTTRTGVTIVQGQTTTCTFSNSLTASETVTFTVEVTNNSLEAVTLFSLEDTENPLVELPTLPTFTTLNGVGDCVTGGTIAGNGGKYTCTFTRTVAGSPGTTHNDKVRAVGKDNELNSDTKLSNLVTVTITQ